MKPITTLLGCWLAVTGLCGCSYVAMETSFQPSRPAVDQEFLEGNWQLEDTFISIAFTPEGLGHFASLKWESNRFVVAGAGTFVTTATVSNRYLSVKYDDVSVGIKQYLLLKYTLEPGNELRLWPPSPEAFAAAVSNGMLSGSVKWSRIPKGGGRPTEAVVTLTERPEHIVRFVESYDHARLFDPSNTVVLTKAVKAVTELDVGSVGVIVEKQ